MSGQAGPSQAADQGGTGVALDAFELARADLIPCLEAFLGTMLELVPFADHEAFSVINLGVGSGAIAECLKHYFPHAQMFLADPDPRRLEVARLRLKGLSRISTFEVDLAKGPLPQGADLAVSSLGLQGQGSAQNSGLFLRILEALRPGGRLIVVDRVRAMSPEAEELTHQRWLAAVLARGEVGIGDPAFGLMGQALSPPIEAQLAGLRAVGFTHVDLWFKQFFFAVYGGDRAPEREG